MKQRVWQNILNLLLLGVAAHSIGLGVSLLFFPAWSLRFVGWGAVNQLFWPSQAGLFLILLGVTYAMAIKLQPLIWIVIASKMVAIIFLFSSVMLLDAPRIVPLLAMGDGLMGLVVACVFVIFRRVTQPTLGNEAANGREVDESLENAVQLHLSATTAAHQRGSE